ncbi:MAG: hypothetical protein R2712_29220 [Vicinamibacterales bacterium]
MKPPARLSDHSTWRTLVTRAAMGRPRTSKRMRSPTWMPKRSLMLSSIETSTSASGSLDALFQNCLFGQALVVLERVPVGDRVFA